MKYKCSTPGLRALVIVHIRVLRARFGQFVQYWYKLYRSCTQCGTIETHTASAWKGGWTHRRCESCPAYLQRRSTSACHWICYVCSCFPILELQQSLYYDSISSRKVRHGALVNQPGCCVAQLVLNFGLLPRPLQTLNSACTVVAAA